MEETRASIRVPCLANAGRSAVTITAATFSTLTFERSTWIPIRSNILTKLWTACVDTAYLQMEDVLAIDAWRERTNWSALDIMDAAVAGFGDQDIDIETKESVLTVKAQKGEEPDTEDRKILHRGIAARSFERRFQLADHVEVKGASLENGLLHIDLVREVPEAMKPRKIAIASGGARQIEAKAA